MAKKGVIPWNKGLNKQNNESVRKISRTMKRRKIDNFAKWREEAKKSGRIVVNYPSPKRNGDLAELIGVVLGDGYIGKFPRSEVLRITSNSNNPGFVKRYGKLVELVLGKAPVIADRKNMNATIITIYQKDIAKRLGLKTGKKTTREYKLPGWIGRNKEFTKRHLRGLFESDGSFSVHESTYTHKFIFTNYNESLLKNVYELLRSLGLHPHRSRHKVQISKKDEVYKAMEMLQFRQY